jgi:hypothetical protein
MRDNEESPPPTITLARVQGISSLVSIRPESIRKKATKTVPQPKYSRSLTFKENKNPPCLVKERITKKAKEKRVRYAIE